MWFDSDEEWRRLGRSDPYLQTVRTLDPYKLEAAEESPRDRYFESGENYVRDLFATIERYVRAPFQPRLAVDFGCSVGRLAIPLARRAQRTIGLDVSTEALEEAERNADHFGVASTRWLRSDDHLSRVDEPIDFFHSYNVLQHLPVERGLAVVGRALDLMAPGGVLAVHVPYRDEGGRIRRAINWAQAHVPGVHVLANLARRRPWDYPHMLMNAYNLGDLVALVRARGCEGLHCKPVDQERYPGVIIIARVAR
jgi:2-polyprenyl-3-methyl-5-hydroxy-6-metoxy-1,4-benzoquinol methylase